MKRLLFLFLICFSTKAYAFDFQLWDSLLKRHVSPSQINGTSLTVVNYVKMGKDPDFARLILQLEQFSPEKLSDDEERKSFWSNVYNIFAIKIVVDHYPVENIRDIGSLFKPVWKRDAGIVGGKTYSLDHIEHQILRKLEDPRIHAAINCASVSCPDFLKEAFVPTRISEQLDESMRNFLANPKKGIMINKEKNIVYLSHIFKWFQKDFETAGGSIEFIKKYVSRDQALFLSQAGIKVRYLDYDWSLNDLASVSP